jgi:hypothetical protein
LLTGAGCIILRLFHLLESMMNASPEGIFLEIIELRNQFEQTTNAIHQEVQECGRIKEEIQLMEEKTTHFEEKIKKKIK